MAWPTDTAWPGSNDSDYGSGSARVDSVDIVWARDINFLYTQTKVFQQFIGNTGELLGEQLGDGYGPGGLVSPNDPASAVGIELAAWDEYIGAAGNDLFRIVDDKSGSGSGPTVVASIDDSGILVVSGGIDVGSTEYLEIPHGNTLPATFEEGRVFRKDDEDTIYHADGSAWNAITGTDTNAVHVNVGAEISGISAKGSPTTSDYMLIEDAADSNNKKSITIGDIPSLGVDSNAVHVNVGGEVSGLSYKGSPTTSDYLMLEDNADSDNKKYTTLGDLPGGVDPTAIHDNVAGEINAVASKATPVDADVIVIEDSEDSFNKKKATLDSLPGGGGSGESVGCSNESVTMGASATELKIGQMVIDGSSASSFNFKALVEPSSGASCEIRIYDRGPVSGPPTTPIIAAKLTTGSSGLQRLSETLTAVADPTSTWPDNNQIYNVARMYDIRGYISGTAGDVLYVGKVWVEPA